MSIERDVDSAPLGQVPYDPPQAAPGVSGRMAGGDAPSAGRVPTGTVLDRVYELFDVDTADVVERMLLSLNPFLKVPFLTNGLLDSSHGTSVGTIVNGKKPDLWGPIWIYFTLVFAVFFSATTALLFESSFDSYDIGLLTGTAGTLFAFTFVVPVLAWFAIQYFSLVPSLTLMQTVCLYGYSCTIWIPAVLVAGSPFGAERIVGKVASIVVRSVTIGVAFLFSADFVYGNLYKVMASQASQAVAVDRTKMALVLVAGVVVHAALAVTLMFL